MKKLLLIAALFISLNGFAQKTTLHKMTSVNANNLKEIRAIQSKTVKPIAKKAVSSVKANADKSTANYYLDFVDLLYGLDFSRRNHIASNIEFGDNGKVYFPNMLLTYLLPDQKIEGVLNSTGDKITITNGQSMGTIQGSYGDIKLSLCRVHLSEDGSSVDYDIENPLVLNYNKDTKRIYVENPDDSYLALVEEDNYNGFYAIGSGFDYIPAEMFPAPQTVSYSYDDYDWVTHEGEVTVISLPVEDYVVYYFNGLFTEKLEDGDGNVLADYSQSWLVGFNDENGNLLMPIMQTLANDVGVAMMDQDQELYTGAITFNYDADLDSYVQQEDYMLVDIFSGGQQGQLSFTTTHSGSIIGKPTTAGVENTVADTDNKEIESTVYYDLSGRRINNIQKGAAIKIIKYTDGTTKAVKFVK